MAKVVYDLFNNAASKDALSSLNSNFSTISDTISELEKKHTKLEKCFGVFEKAFNNNMKNLAKHLEAHNAFESHLREVENRIEKYVTQQLNNSKILQVYIERELFLSQLSNEICYAQINALIKAPWWRKLTKKKREYIMLKAKVETQDKYKERLNELNERLTQLTKRFSEDEESNKKSEPNV